MLKTDDVIKTEETTISFYDEMNNKTDAFYEVKITIKTRLYSTGNEYYDIGYSYRFHKEELTDPDDILHYRKVIHPFYKVEDKDGKLGDIIKKNRMTTVMIEFLLMSDEALTREDIGMTTPQRYRVGIMHSLADLWD